MRTGHHSMLWPSRGWMGGCAERTRVMMAAPPTCHALPCPAMPCGKQPCWQREPAAGLCCCHVLGRLWLRRPAGGRLGAGHDERDDHRGCQGGVERERETERPCMHAGGLQSAGLPMLACQGMNACACAHAWTHVHVHPAEGEHHLLHAHACMWGQGSGAPGRAGRAGCGIQCGLLWALRCCAVGE